MALTDSQRADTRRWLGYPIRIDGAEDDVGLDAVLDVLTATQEVMLTDTYLANLTTLEAAILTAADNLDTEVAGPWTANKREITQRTALFRQWRLDLCAFLGFTPGPWLNASTSGFSLVRA